MKININDYLEEEEYNSIGKNSSHKRKGDKGDTMSHSQKKQSTKVGKFKKNNTKY